MENELQNRGISIFLRMKPLLQQDIVQTIKSYGDFGLTSSSKIKHKGGLTVSQNMTLSNGSGPKGEQQTNTEQEFQELKWFRKEDQTHIKDLKSKKMFDFDLVFDETAPNRTVFQHVFPNDFNFIFEAKKFAILMYGQTASGKTHTMKGKDPLDGTTALKSSKDMRIEEELEGIVQLTLRKVLRTLELSKGTKYNLKLSYLELYNEEIHDLLENGSNADKRRLRIFKGDNGHTVVEGLNRPNFSTLEEALAIFERGEKNRKFAYTKQNHNSSRSHVFLEITIETRRQNVYQNTTSSIILADLAGSEKYNENLEHDTRAEAKDINKSLLALSRVITQLNSKSDYNLFRDSKLTRILEPYLTGNSRTVIICTISLLEKNHAESLTTLTFGMTAKGIKFATKKDEHQPIDQPTSSQEHLQMLADLEAQREQISRLEAENNELKKTNLLFQTEREELVMNCMKFEKKWLRAEEFNKEQQRILDDCLRYREQTEENLKMMKTLIDAEDDMIGRMSVRRKSESHYKQTPIDLTQEELDFEELRKNNRTLEQKIAELQEELRIQKIIKEPLINPNLLSQEEWPDNPRLPRRDRGRGYDGPDTASKFATSVSKPVVKRINNQMSYEDLLKDREWYKRRVDHLEKDEARHQKRQCELLQKIDQKNMQIHDLQKQVQSLTAVKSLQTPTKSFEY